MKVLHVIQRYYPYIGGAEQVFFEIGARLARDGESVTVYTTNAWDLERFWRADKRAIQLENETLDRVYIQRFPIEYLPFSALAFPAIKRGMALVAALSNNSLPLLFRMARYVPYVPALNDALATTAERFDLAHTANISLDSSVVATYRFAQRTKIPFVITPFLHLGESDDETVVRFYTLPHQIEMLRRADAVIVMTEREGNALRERGVAPEKIHRIGAGVEPTEILGGDGARFRQARNLSAPIITFIGTAAYDKGTAHLVEAMQKVWQTRDATLILAGAQLSDFEKFFATQPPEVQTRVRRLGFINAHEKRDLLAATDIFVMPSRTDSFGIVYLEAWLYDKPVIGARAGGVPEVIDDGQNGFLVKFGDTDAIAARILELLEHRALAERLGRQGHQKVLREMTWARQYGKVRELYQALTRRPTRA